MVEASTDLVPESEGEESESSDSSSPPCHADEDYFYMDNYTDDQKKQICAHIMRSEIF